MTSGVQPPSSGAPVPVAGVTGGPPVLGGQISNDPNTGNVVVAPNPGQVLQVRKGNTPTALQVYEYFHTNTDYSRIALNSQTNGPFSLAVETAPSTVIRALNISANGNIQLTAGGAFLFGGNGSNQWQVPTSGNLLAVTDASFDIGQSAFGRPRNIYITGTLFSVTGINTSGSIQFSGDGPAFLVRWNSGAYVQGQTNGLELASPGFTNPIHLRGSPITLDNTTQITLLQFNNAFATSATVGAATALPATPALYFNVIDQAGNPRKIPAYNP